jgi:hypothetical protein
MTTQKHSLKNDKRHSKRLKRRILNLRESGPGNLAVKLYL